MHIPLEFYQYLRSQIRTSDIIRQYIPLNKKGPEYSGLCPFHKEKTPSFTVNDQKGFYHCFGCNAHGDFIKFTSEIKGISYKDSAILIAQDNNIELPKLTQEQSALYKEVDYIHDILSQALNFFKSQINNKVINYLHNRHLSQQQIEHFSVGYAPGNGSLIDFFNSKSIPIKDLVKAGLISKREDGSVYEIFNKRIIFPIFNTYNKIIGFGGRVLDNSLPKYINSPETILFKKSDHMYGENFATSDIYKNNYAILVEGFLDVIALHKANFNSAVSSLGTACSEKHLQKLWKLCNEIVICLDGDEAGTRASARLIKLALPHIKYDKTISFITLPNGADPDDIINKDGGKTFQILLQKRTILSQKIWENEYLGKDISTAEAKAELEVKLLQYSTQIEDKILSINFKRYFKQQIWNYLVRGKNKSQSTKKYDINNEVLSLNDYSEYYIIEQSLCYLLIHHPEILSNQQIRDFFLTNTLHVEDFNDLKDWFCEEFLNDQCESLTRDKIVQKLESSRFKDVFLLISQSNSLFVDSSFLNSKVDNKYLLFDWLSKKYYLLLLQDEFNVKINAAQNDNTQIQALSYIEEIQKIHKEIHAIQESLNTY